MKTTGLFLLIIGGLFTGCVNNASVQPQDNSTQAAEVKQTNKSKLFDLNKVRLYNPSGGVAVTTYDVNDVYVHTNMSKSKRQNAYVANFKDPAGVLNIEFKEALSDFTIIEDVEIELSRGRIKFSDEFGESFLISVAQGGLAFGGRIYKLDNDRFTLKIEKTGSNISMFIDGKLANTIPFTGVGPVKHFKQLYSSSTNPSYQDKLFSLIITKQK